MSVDDHKPEPDMAAGARTQASEEMTDTVTPPWQRPQVTRVSLEQTLNHSGTLIDSTAPSTMNG
jgi:hypothetical protein